MLRNSAGKNRFENMRLGVLRDNEDNSWIKKKMYNLF